MTTDDYRDLLVEYENLTDKQKKKGEHVEIVIRMDFVRRYMRELFETYQDKVAKYYRAQLDRGGFRTAHWRGEHMKTPSYMKVTIGGTDRKLYANIKIKRWGWGWLAFSRVRPERLRDYPLWVIACMRITVKGLAGKMP